MTSKIKKKVSAQNILFALSTIYFVKYYVLSTSYYLRPSSIIPLAHDKDGAFNFSSQSSIHFENSTYFFVNNVKHNFQRSKTLIYKVNDSLVHEQQVLCSFNSNCDSYILSKDSPEIIHQGYLLNQKPLQHNSKLLSAFLIFHEKKIHLNLIDIKENRPIFENTIWLDVKELPKKSFIQVVDIGSIEFIIGFSIQFNHWDLTRISIGGLVLKSSNHSKKNEEPKEEKNWRQRIIKKFENSDSVVHLDWSSYHDSLLQLMPFRVNRHDVSVKLLRVAQDGRIKKINVNEFLSRTNKKFNSFAILEEDSISLYDISSLTKLSSINFDLPPLSTIYPVYEGSKNSFFYQSINFDSTIGPKAMFSFTKSVNDIEHYHVGNATFDFNESEFGHTVNCYLYTKLVDDENFMPSRLPNGGKKLFSQDLCRPHNLWQHSRFGRREWLEDTGKNPPPLVEIKKLIECLSLKERTSVCLEKDDFTVYALTSDGSINAFNKFGREIFRVESQVSWLQISRSVKQSTGEDPISEKYAQFRPSLNSHSVGIIHINSEFLSQLTNPDGKIARNVDMRMKEYQDILITVGWDSIAFVDKSAGTFMASHSLPSYPIGDIIIVGEEPYQIYVPCKESIIGLIIGRKVLFSYYIFFTWVLATLLIWIVRKIDIFDGYSRRESEDHSYEVDFEDNHQGLFDELNEEDFYVD